MLKNTNQSIANCLENVAEICMLLHDGLYDGTIPDLATEADDSDLRARLKFTVLELQRYRDRCFAEAERQKMLDPGPSQEQRL